MERMSEIRNVLPVSLFIWAVFHLLSGCTQTEVVDGPQLPEAGKEVQATFHLNVLANRDSQTRSIAFTADGTVDTDSIPVNPKDTVKTKSPNPLIDGDESLIAQLWIGQYDVDGSCVFNQYFSVITGGKVDVRLKDSGGKEHHVWFVANAGDLGKIDTEADLKQHVLTYSSTEAGLPENQLCGMTGMWEGVINERGVENISVDLTRLVARISFTYRIGGTDFSFTPASVTLNSVPDKYQIGAAKSQLTADVNYKTYSCSDDNKQTTIYWYLPENMAGTASGENVVKSDKQKTGKGVTNATYIELTGQTVQSGVTYENVRFRFYPGSNENNYDIERNSHYTMNVTLAGIDITDERITVGTIPPIEITPGNMPAGVGGEKELQITARPGQPWMIKLPDWLSAQVKDKNLTVPVSGSITYQGPAQLQFKAETANPKAETRTFSFPLTITSEEQTIEIVQDGSTLEAGGSISLGAVTGSEGSSTFMATKGLPWRAVLSDGSWLTWASSNPGTGGDATGGNQNLIVRATASNPYAKERSVNITVEGGESIGSVDYHNLQKNISVKQVGSTVQGSEVEVEPEAANAQSSSFIATPGLVWVANVTNGDWISFSGATSGNPTTGSAQSISFNVTVNPTAFQRSGAITVRAGNETEGPTGVLMIKQKASSLTASINPSTPLAATAGASGAYMLNGTNGLAYSFTTGFPSWLTVSDGTASTSGGTTTGSDQQLTYQTASVNPNSTERSATVTVKAGNIMGDVTIQQAGSTFTVDKTEIELESTGTPCSVQVTGTEGLPWTVSPSATINDITPATTSYTATGSAQALTFNATQNNGGDREATFTVAVTGGNHSKTVKVKQKAGRITLTVDQSVLTSYKNATPGIASYPPFDYNGTDRLPNGCTYNGSAMIMTGSYIIQVQKGQKDSRGNYSAMEGYCSRLDEDGLSGWRIPTNIEWHAISKKKDMIENFSSASKFGESYWCSSVCSSGRSRYSFVDNTFSWNNMVEGGYLVRCVRDF